MTLVADEQRKTYRISKKPWACQECGCRRLGFSYGYALNETTYRRVLKCEHCGAKRITDEKLVR